MDLSLLLWAAGGAALATFAVVHERDRRRFRAQFLGSPGFIPSMGPDGDYHVRYFADGLMHELSPMRGAFVDAINESGLPTGTPFFIGSPSSSIVSEPLTLDKQIISGHELDGVKVRAAARFALAELLTSSPLHDVAVRLFMNATTSLSVDRAGAVSVARDSSGHPDEGKQLVLDVHAFVLALSGPMKVLTANAAERPGGGAPLAIPWTTRK